MMLEQTKAMLELAKQEVRSVQYTRIRNAVANAKNAKDEVLAVDFFSFGWYNT